MNSFELGQAIGYWAIPVLLAIWVIIKIAAKLEKKGDNADKGKGEKKTQPKETDDKKPSDDYDDDGL